MHRDARPRKAVAATSPPPLAFVAVVVANVALAFGPWFVREADVGPVAAGFWRMALGLPFIAALAVAGGARPGRPAPGVGWLLALGGLAFAADLASWHIGIRLTTLANATLFGNTATFLFPLYGFLVMRAWPSRQQGVALLLAAAGALLLMGRSLDLDPARLTGDLLCVLAGVLYTVYFIAVARARETMAPLSLLALSTATSAVPLLLFALALGERVWPGAWGALVGLALASQVLGQGCMIYALGKLSPLVIGLALLIQPIVGATLGWIAYGERLGLVDWIGAALIAAALVLVQRRAVAPPPVVAQVAAEEAR